MPRIHLDTDIGGDMDDLCALAMLLKWPDLEITGITTVAEEQGRRAGYTRYALRLADRDDIPVCAGADVAQGYYRFAPGYPEDAQMWPEPVLPAPGSVDNALDLLRHSVEQGAILVGIGPYTNFALLDQKYPGTLQDAQLYLMGGYPFPPRPGFPSWDETMDYNIQLDVPSAEYVLTHANPTLIPLAITVETALRRAYLPTLEQADPLAALIARQAAALDSFWQNAERYGETCSGLPDDLVNFQHDPLACAVALGWDGVTIQEWPLSLERKEGWLVEHVESGGKPIRMVTQVDGPRFNEFWFQIVTGQ